MREQYSMRQEEVPEIEQRKVKEYIKGHTVISMERSSYVAHWAGWQELMLGRIDLVDEVLERVEAVSSEDVLSLAQLLFTTDKLHLALVGPLNGTAAYRRVLSLD